MSQKDNLQGFNGGITEEILQQSVNDSFSQLYEWYENHNQDKSTILTSLELILNPKALKNRISQYESKNLINKLKEFKIIEDDSITELRNKAQVVAKKLNLALTHQYRINDALLFWFSEHWSAIEDAYVNNIWEFNGV